MHAAAPLPCADRTGPPPPRHFWREALAGALLGLLDVGVALAATVGARALALLAPGNRPPAPPRGVATLSLHLVRLMRAGAKLALLGGWLDEGNLPVFRSKAASAAPARFRPGGGARRGAAGGEAGARHRPPGVEAMLREFATRPIGDILAGVRRVLVAAARRGERPDLILRVCVLLRRARAALLRLRLAPRRGPVLRLPARPPGGGVSAFARVEAVSQLA